MCMLKKYLHYPCICLQSQTWAWSDPAEESHWGGEPDPRGSNTWDETETHSGCWGAQWAAGTVKTSKATILWIILNTQLSLAFYFFNFVLRILFIFLCSGQVKPGESKTSSGEGNVRANYGGALTDPGQARWGEQEEEARRSGDGSSVPLQRQREAEGWADRALLQDHCKSLSLII